MKFRFTRTILVITVIALFLVPLFGIRSPVFAQDRATMVRIAPQSITVNPGDVFTVEVWVDDVLDLYGVDIQLAFPAGALEVVDPNPSTPAIEIIPRYDLLQPDSILQRSADNSAGSIGYVVTQLNPTPAASGSGALFEFQFRALASGTHAITFSNHQLAAPGGVPISHTVQGATYTVTGNVMPTHRYYLPIITH
jgi:hypothetical protein